MKIDSGLLIFNLLQLKGRGPKKITNFVKQNAFNLENCLKSLSSVLTDKEKDDFKRNLPNAILTLRQSHLKEINWISILDSSFPSKLYNCTDGCVFLFYKGNINLLNEKGITIIGSRNIDDNYVRPGIDASSYFASKGYVIVSGLAIGCDTYAHRGCLDVGGKTIAVLPSSLDNILPTRNSSLADEIIKNDGLIISEVPIGTLIHKSLYVRRDRIQSLLTNTALVIQCSIDSGTMIAVRKHIKDGKRVFGLKGFHNIEITNRIDPYSNFDLEKVERFI